MGRVLGLDWDHQQLRVVEATVKGGKVHVRRALASSEAISPNPADTEGAGRLLRERLKEAGIAPAPVLACVGRDRVVMRDIHYPDVPPEEIAAVVNFQAVKELTFAANEAVIDYSLVRAPWPTGEKRALAVILRQELLTTYQELCHAAGLKLQKLSVRSYGMAACAGSAARAAGEPSAETISLLVIADGAGELCVARGPELLFSRVITAGPGANLEDPAAFLPELRRTLAAYAGQFPQLPVRTLLVAGGKSTSGNEALAQALRLQVRSFDPLAGAEAVGAPVEDRGAFAGALGLLEASSAGKLPVDFVSPKEATPPRTNARYWVLGIAAAAALLLLGLTALYFLAHAGRNTQIEQLTQTKQQLQKQLAAYGDVEKRYDAISGWSGNEIVMLDELYDVIAIFPDMPKVRITKLSWTPDESSAVPTPRPGVTAKPVALPAQTGLKPVGKLQIEAEAESAEDLDRLRRALENGRHWKLVPDKYDSTGPPVWRATYAVFRKEPGEYQHLLSPTVNKTSGSSGDGNRPPRRPGGRP